MNSSLTKEMMATAQRFPEKSEAFELDLPVSIEAFKVFDHGIFANTMDEKWNIFVLEDFLYWVRSWTGFVIFKVLLERTRDVVWLRKVFVNRDANEYKSESVAHDKEALLWLLDIYLAEAKGKNGE